MSRPGATSFDGTGSTMQAVFQLLNSCLRSIDCSTGRHNHRQSSYEASNLVGLIGAAIPVFALLVAGVRNNTLGTRP
jgi:hypothetical protein